MTEKLFYLNPYLTNFQAMVTSCKRMGDKYIVVLDKTAFYPEGGGQPADWGYIGDASVSDVAEEDGVVYHVVDRPIPSSTRVEGEIDWTRRLDLMQHHSGEHIISGIICEKYNCQNVGFHMGTDAILIDFNAKIPKEDIAGLEEKANEAIWKNIPVQVSYPPRDELAALDYRSKIEIEGDVRIVCVSGYDCCACCGLHVRQAGEVGSIQIIAHQSYKGGTRLSILSGKRALDYSRVRREAADAVGRMLSVPGENIAPAVESLQEEKSQLITKLNQLKWESFRQRAEELTKDGRDVAYYADGLTGKDMTNLADCLVEKTDGRAFVFTEVEGGFAYVLLSRKNDAKQLLDVMQKQFPCKGGGKMDAVQGRISTTKENIIWFFEAENFLIG